VEEEMGEAPAFQIYVADFYMDTNGWSGEEVGYYVRLLFNQWVNGSIPSDEARLARVAQASLEAFQRAWEVMSSKFVDDGKGNLINLRLEETRAQQELRRAKLSESGRKGGKRTQILASEKQSEALSEGSTTDSSLDKPLQSSSKEVVIKDITTSRQFLSCPHQEIVKIYHEECPTMRRVVIWNGARQVFLRARWNEDQERQTLEWWATFLKRCNASDFLSGRSEPTPGRRQFVADLEWLVRPTNFVKVIEGRYDNTKPTGSDGGKRSLVL
jgi:uncharacterized protein YdaU (DUF1376 family)